MTGPCAPIWTGRIWFDPPNPGFGDSLESVLDIEGVLLGAESVDEDDAEGVRDAILNDDDALVMSVGSEDETAPCFQDFLNREGARIRPELYTSMK